MQIQTVNTSGVAVLAYRANHRALNVAYTTLSGVRAQTSSLSASSIWIVA
jgi:hypothetical protein